MIDIIYLGYNRLAFTKESIAALIANTEWAHVRKLVIYDDGSSDGTREYLRMILCPVETVFVPTKLAGPVAITNNYLHSGPTEIFAKIDNDTMLPPYWLSESLKVMAAHPELDLLGIEAFNTVAPGQIQRAYKPAKHIGGIGLIRKRCFKTLPKPNGRFGFTGWQHENGKVTKGWINPSIPVFLLDRMYFDPWARLSREYIAKGWQRKWAPYDESRKALWQWWKP